MRSSGPLFLPRLFLYGMACIWGIISLSLGINGIVKKSQLIKHYSSEVASEGITLDVHGSNLFAPAIASEVFCCLIALFGFLSFAGLFTRRMSTAGALKMQGFVYSFLACALFASQVPVSNTARTDSFSVEAFQNGVQLPAELVQAAAASFGLNLQYKSFDWIVWFAVMPWIAFLFSLLSAVASFIARPAPPAERSSSASIAVSAEEKNTA
ncbi:hypothetical protein FISHEDRAFT_77075 [Fistulina hepatica ATCC 64428]|uniref:Uncharacterized protein n=1 Tax=Fistulina hepatica ATCC 64428 TaxID=1128425 RepID=A0A0D7A3B2_9AGAR|nr:hypothetical protein FISHEDRAFT_77075 [Fistulina hepatica ATCC 64428]